MNLTVMIADIEYSQRAIEACPTGAVNDRLQANALIEQGLRANIGH
jgi:hypothetical protein